MRCWRRLRHAVALAQAGLATEETGDPNDGFELLQLAQIKLFEVPRSDERREALEAWVRADSATALAHLGRPDDARSAITAARDGWDPRALRAGDVDLVAARLALESGRYDTAEAFAASSVRRWSGHTNRRAAVLSDITHATVYVQAGEPRGTPLADHAIRGVAELRSQRARVRLLPLADALAARPGSDARELARTARKVAATRV
ncbi:MAG: hypothetical protein ACRDT0_25550 [Pseudonocardiaceae bacterium]